MYTLTQIIDQLGGELCGVDKRIERLRSLTSAKEGDISFFFSTQYIQQVKSSQAAAIIVAPDLIAYARQSGASLIVVSDVYLYFAKLAALFYQSPELRPGLHPTAIVGQDSVWGESSEMAAHVFIGERVRIGERCKFYPGVVIGDDCVIGDGVTLYPRVTLYAHCLIGQNVIIHAGAVIGADGFGFAREDERWLKIPQTGRVMIDDDVEIGANTTIDRGALDDTVIAKGVKIDNLVQIAHNVHIGRHTAIAGCVGIAGSTHIGAYCVIGGAAMLAGHLTIADYTHIGGGTAVAKSITQAGEYAAIFPLLTKQNWRKNAVHIRHIDELVKRVTALECVSTAAERSLDASSPLKGC